MLPPFSCRSSVLRHTALKYRLGITYIYQIQALGRSRGAGGTAVARGYNGCKIFHTQLSAPYIQQGAYKGTHHIAQKAIGRNVKDQQGAALFPIGFLHFTEVGLVVAPQLAETGKIAALRQQGSGFVHARHIHGETQARGQLLTKWVLYGAGVVFVATSYRIETTVCIGCHFAYRIYDDVAGQKTV